MSGKRALVKIALCTPRLCQWPMKAITIHCARINSIQNRHIIEYELKRKTFRLSSDLSWSMMITRCGYDDDTTTCDRYTSPSLHVSITTFCFAVFPKHVSARLCWCGRNTEMSSTHTKATKVVYLFDYSPRDEF